VQVQSAAYLEVQLLFLPASLLLLRLLLLLLLLLLLCFL
jgi:hypothetical protein